MWVKIMIETDSVVGQPRGLSNKDESPWKRVVMVAWMWFPFDGGL